MATRSSLVFKFRPFSFVTLLGSVYSTYLSQSNSMLEFNNQTLNGGERGAMNWKDCTENYLLYPLGIGRAKVRYKSLDLSRFDLLPLP